MAWLPPRAGAARPALAAAAGVLLAVLATIWLGLDYPWWAALGAWNAAGADRAAVARQVPRILLGTLGGAAASVVLAAATGGVLLLEVLAMLAAGTIGSARRFASPGGSLGWAFATLTVLLVLGQSVLAPISVVDYAALRVGEIACGAAAGALAALLLGPPGTAAAPPPAPPPVVEAPAGASVPLGPAALVGGALMPAIALLWSGLGLPAVLLTSVLAGFAFDRDLIALRRGVGGRLLGCLAGGLYALAVLPLGLDRILLWAAALGGGLTVFAMLRLSAEPRLQIAGLQAGVILIFGLITGSGPPSDVVGAVNLIVGITTAMAIVTGTGLVLRSLRPA